MLHSIIGSVHRTICVLIALCQIIRNASGWMQLRKLQYSISCAVCIAFTRSKQLRLVNLQALHCGYDLPLQPCSIFSQQQQKNTKEINKSVIATEVERKKGAFRIIVLSNFVAHWMQSIRLWDNSLFRFARTIRKRLKTNECTLSTARIMQTFSALHWIVVFWLKDAVALMHFPIKFHDEFSTIQWTHATLLGLELRSFSPRKMRLPSMIIKRKRFNATKKKNEKPRYESDTPTIEHFESALTLTHEFSLLSFVINQHSFWTMLIKAIVSCYWNDDHRWFGRDCSKILQNHSTNEIMSHNYHFVENII